jgi:hypothetical protein
MAQDWPPEDPELVWPEKKDREPRTGMPFSLFFPILIGAGLGLLLRTVVFAGSAGSRFSAMGTGFIWLAPMAMGALTVYLAEKQQRRSFTYYWFAPMAATALMVLGSMLIMIEGLICAILIVPVLSVMGGLGGLLMGLVCRLTNWPRATLHSLMALPLLVALAGPGGAGPQRLGMVERSVLIQSNPAQVWTLINHVPDIRTEEVQDAWTYRIGVPRPLSGTTVTEGVQRVRKVVWDKGVHFDEVITDWEPQRHLRWTYRFAPDSVPAGALDDHVRLGGTYFDLRDTAYTLTQEGQAVRLHLRISYRLSTDFNAYANWLAQNLIGDFAETVLTLYQRRAEFKGPARAEGSVAQLSRP